MRMLGVVAVLGGLLAATPVRAQFVVGPVGGAAVMRGGLSLNFQSRNLSLSAFAGRTSIVGYGGFPLGGFYGYRYAGPWLPPPIVILPPPVVILPPPIIVVPPIVVHVVADEPRVPDPDRFIVIRPNKPDAVPPLDIRPDKPKAAPPVVPPARVAKKPKQVDLGIAPGALPLAPGPAANPRREAELQIETGNAAFAKGEYGRALERFRQATTLLPDDAQAWFLLAQAQFAIGKYDEATASIIAGLKRQPDWPLSAFRSRDLYRANPLVYVLHLRNLRDAVAADPDDPRLLFLLGVQLWFDGKRDEADPLFEKAARRAIDPAPAQSFLKFKK